jgi:hypothetical protein
MENINEEVIDTMNMNIKLFRKKIKELEEENEKFKKINKKLAKQMKEKDDNWDLAMENEKNLKEEIKELKETHDKELQEDAEIFKEMINKQAKVINDYEKQTECLEKMNEELIKKADADNTIKMIEKLNEELDEVRKEKDEVIMKLEAKISDFETKEDPTWNADIRVGAYSKGRFNESWLLMEDCFGLMQDNGYNIVDKCKYNQSMWKFNRRMEDFYECIMGVRTQDWCKDCKWLDDAKNLFFEELQEAWEDIDGIEVIYADDEEDEED